MADVDVLRTLKKQRAKLRDDIGELEGELRRVDAAIAAYQRNSRAGAPRGARRRGGGRKKGSKQSAATKRKISRAMKKRWAQRKKSKS